MIHVYLTLGIVLLGVGALAGIVWLAERKGRSDAQREQADESMQRLRDAIEADARGRERIARGELLSDDGHRRD